MDAFLGGAHTLAVPIRERWHAAADRGKLCWLTVEDVVRFLLSSVGVFSATASRSVTELGVVRPAALAVAAGDSALSAVPLLRTALASHASVAVVAGTGTGSPARRLQVIERAAVGYLGDGGEEPESSIRSWLPFCPSQSRS